MTPVRLLIDADLSPDLPRQLERHGFESRHVREAGSADDPDRRQFILARRYDALVTSDMHRDARTRIVALEASCLAIRIIRVNRPKQRSFPADRQAARILAHRDAIVRELQDPEGARVIALHRDGTGIRLTRRDEIARRLERLGREPWPAREPGGG